VLDHLKGELVRSMALCGVARLEDITADLVADATRSPLL
jgi:isopentenyl diphosphate isomerase/L-lactate dehydrogenase-like FMN-dependent dehydrogenase